MSFRSILSKAMLLAILVSRASAATAQSTQATVSGRVTDAANGQPIPAAQVSVVGTNIGTQTNSDGQYTIRGLPAGAVELRVLRVGFREQRQSATLSAGQTTVDFKMSSAPVQLTAVVTTATGEQRQREVGNDIPHIDAAAITQTAAVTNVTDLLATRAPGVQVLTGVQTGAGSRVRIRGISSLSLANSPIYVIDGVRM